MENRMLKFIGSISAMAIFILLIGVLMSKNNSDSITNKNNNSNTVIFSGYSEPIEKVKGKKKININTANLQDFKDLKIGIGRGKYTDIVKNRPFTKVSQLITRHTVGPDVYRNIKDIAVVD